MSSIEHRGFEGWYFEDGCLCTPNGDRLTPLVIMACLFQRQLDEVRHLIYWKPEVSDSDCVMPADLRPVAREQRIVTPHQAIGAIARKGAGGVTHRAPPRTADADGSFPCRYPTGGVSEAVRPSLSLVKRW